MPTSREARIHAASTYNLSKLPVSSSSSKPPVPSSSTTSLASKFQSRVKSVSNFEKMHKNWQKKFQQGKAVSKKPCSRTREFDLTWRGTHFKSAYYSGDEYTDPEDEFEADQDALQSILDNRGLSNDVITGRSTVAVMGSGRPINSGSVEHRQTLGALPTRDNRTNMFSAIKTPRRALGLSAQRNNKLRKKSLVEQQKLDGLEFEEDAAALATILNDVGIQQQPMYGYDRQTIASTHARIFQQRTSIYYQPQRNNINKVYEDFARQTIGGPLSPTVMKIREYAVSQTIPNKLHASPFHNNLSSQLQRTALFNHAVTNRTRTPGRVTRPKTPGTASRVLNPRAQKALEQSCSPVLCSSNQPSQPRSALKVPNSTTKSASRNVCWAEILNSPPDQSDAIPSKGKPATALFADEDAQFEAPYSMAQKQQQELKKIEVHISANRNKVEETEAVELQLQMEIERLQMAEDVPKPAQPTASSLQHLQTVPATQQQMITSQPQYIGQQSQAVASMKTMPESGSRSGQNPPQSSTVNHGDRGIYVQVSQPQMASGRMDNASSQYELRQTYLPAASMHNIPSHSTHISQQTHCGQFQHANAIPITSAPQQRPFVNSSNGTSSNIPQVPQDSPQSMSKPPFNLGTDNQKPIASVIENPVSFTDGRSLATNPPAASLPRSIQMPEKKAAPRNAFPPVTNNFARQFQSHPEVAAQSSWTSEPARTLQNSSHVMHDSLSSSLSTSSVMHSGLSTVYGMPAHVIKKNATSTTSALSPVPLMSAFAGGSPVQPTIRSTLEAKPSSAMIQTPLPLKPQHLIKHKVMKQYTPAVPSMQHTIMDVPVPIQTPMAMRNSTQQRQIPGVTGRLVSPVPQVATQIKDELQLQDYSDQYNSCTTTVEPKLKLNFDSVEDTPSGEVKTAIPAGMVGQSLNCQMSGLPGKGQWNKSLAGQLFHETLLDQECALYTCRLPNKFAAKPLVERNHNPIAKVLMEGDDMHFVLISDQLLKQM